MPTNFGFVFVCSYLASKPTPREEIHLPQSGIHKPSDKGGDLIRPSYFDTDDSPEISIRQHADWCCWLFHANS